MRLISFLSVIYLLLCYSRCNAYKPVIVLHGVMSGNASLLSFASNITEAHPGTQVYIPDVFDGWSSLLPMWHQILSIGSIVMNISSSHPEGIILIGHSQGGLIGRGILEAYPDHNVKTFISLSSPQGGQYGTKFLHLFFKNLTKSTAYRLFYSRVGQRTSVGNYWRDPHHEELYTKYSHFLPYLNNDKPSPDSIYFKSGLTKLEKMILIGGPNDGVIAPWQSSQFAYFDEDEKIIELKDQDSYKKDTLGLKTLADSNRLKMYSIPNVSHHMWHNNITVIKKYILPYLN